MLCILYVRNGGRHDGLRIRACEHRWPILVRPISRAKSSKMREDFSGKNQRCSVRPQAAGPVDGVLAKGDVLVVTRLDRLARSTRDLLNLLGTIAEKRAG